MYFQKRFGLRFFLIFGLAALACNLSGTFRDVTIPSSYRSVDWSPEGKRIAVVGDPGLILFMENLEEMALSSDHEFTSVTWHPYRNIVTVRDGASIVLFDATTLAEVIHVTVNDNRAMSWSPDGRMLAVSSRDEIEIWELSSQPNSDPLLQKTKSLIGHQAWVTSISWSPYSRVLASTSQDGTIRIFNALTGQEEKRITLSDLTTVLSGNWSPDGNLIASVDRDSSRVLIWDVSSGTMIMSLDGGQRGLISLEWNPHGNYLISANRREVLVWHLGSERIHKQFSPENGDIWAATWHPDGQRIAVVGAIDDHSTIWVWNMTSNEVFTETFR